MDNDNLTSNSAGEVNLDFPSEYPHNIDSVYAMSFVDSMNEISSGDCIKPDRTSMGDWTIVLTLYASIGILKAL